MSTHNSDVRLIADALNMMPRAVYQKLTYHGFSTQRAIKHEDINKPIR